MRLRIRHRFRIAVAIVLCLLFQQAAMVADHLAHLALLLTA